MGCLGGVEAGGTKFVCGVGTGPDDLERVSFLTTSPTETIRCAVMFLRERSAHRPLSALGVASFGPVDLNPHSPSYGFITSTPKASWRNTDIVGELRRALNLPVGFDTDVNGAALAEARWGAARGLTDLVYLTIGTGIGGGALVGGRLLHGLVHPEMGHLLVPHDSVADPYPGCCPYHGDCWEGLASGTAIAARWGQPGPALPAGHPAWDLEAQYLAKGVASLICTLSPQRIVLGGGVMHQQQLLPLVRQKVQLLLNGYVQTPAILDRMEDYLVLPGLGDNAGVLGALALAEGILTE